MPRKPRIEAPGFYHLVSRGNNKQQIFDDALRTLAVRRAGTVARRFDWLVYAWAVMSNHLHLVIRVGEMGLAAGMQQLNLSLARASNARFGRVDHAFGQRYWSTPIETDEHLLASIRYTLWNPARAGVGEHPGDSDWTSYRATAGLELANDTLALPALLAHFGSQPGPAQDAFERFIGDGHERCVGPWQDGKGILL